MWLPTGLLIGGAAGNLIDRAREGAVTDFVDLPLWPAFNVADAAITIGVLTLLYVLEGPPSRGAASSRLSTPASGWTSSSPAAPGSRAAAQRLIEGGAVLVDGRARAPSATPSRRASGSTVAELPAAPEAEAPDRRRSRSPGRTSTCSSSTSRPASSCTRAPATAPGTLVQALAGRVAGGDDPERPGVVHRLDRDTSGLLVLARSDAVHAALQAALRAREIERELPRARRGPPRRAARHDRRPARAATAACARA